MEYVANAKNIGLLAKNTLKNTRGFDRECVEHEDINLFITIAQSYIDAVKKLDLNKQKAFNSDHIYVRYIIDDFKKERKRQK